MTDAHTETPEAPKPKRKVVRRGGRPRKVVAAPVEAKPSPFAGITHDKCCDACSLDLCVISTVSSCKHPMKAGDGGCGPITMANRKEAMKLLKHQKIEQG